MSGACGRPRHLRLVQPAGCGAHGLRWQRLGACRGCDASRAEAAAIAWHNPQCPPDGDPMTPNQARVAARCTALLDSFGFERLDSVHWDAQAHAFVVAVPAVGENGLPSSRQKFLGAGPASAVLACQRERSKALAPERRAAAREGLSAFVQVLGAVAPVVGAVIPLPLPGRNGGRP